VVDPTQLVDVLLIQAIQLLYYRRTLAIDVGYGLLQLGAKLLPQVLRLCVKGLFIGCKRPILQSNKVDEGPDAADSGLVLGDECLDLVDGARVLGEFLDALGLVG